MDSQRGSWTQADQRDWERTRHSQKLYDLVEQRLHTNGVFVRLRWQETPSHWNPRDVFVSLRVTFDDQRLVINDKARKIKESTETGFHISLGNRTDILAGNGNTVWAYGELKRILRELIHHHFLHVRLMPSGGYDLQNLDGKDHLLFLLRPVVWTGTHKDQIHISMD